MMLKFLILQWPRKNFKILNSYQLDINFEVLLGVVFLTDTIFDSSLLGLS